MGRFSRKIKRNPSNGFVGKKAQEKQIRKMFFKAQQEYWRQLKDGMIGEDGLPLGEVIGEETDEQE